VLSYYLITNLSALTQPSSQRRWPRAVNVLGACGCVVLAVSLPLTSVLTGAAVIAAGLLARLALRGEDPP
jgi:APA family basic amino acid/polyamine antiporter